MRYLLLLIFIPKIVLSQAIFEPISIAQDTNYIISNSNKIQNIYNFSDQILYTHSAEYGNILVLQNYIGQGTPLANSSSFQETNKFRLKYEYNFFDNLYLINNNNWFISANSLNFGQNKLERLNFIVGGKYQYNPEKYVELGYGKERNTTVGIESFGNYYYSNFVFNEYGLDDIMISSNGFADIVVLNDGRQNQDISTKLNALRLFEQSGSIDISFEFLNRNRDNPELNPGLDDIPIRSRKSDKFLLLTNLSFDLTDDVSNIISLGLNNEVINNNYSKNFAEINESKFRREVDIFQFDLSNSLTYSNDDFNFYSYIYYSQLNEDYSAFNVLNLPSNQFDIFRKDQNRQDKIATTFNMKFRNDISLTELDSVNIRLDYGLLRFDTPSLDNNDDRDEQSLSGEVEYLRKVSDMVSIGLKNDFRFYHYVYLKAQRSSSNNWNRIIRLAPTILIKSKSLYYKPNFGINANYTTYDFENIVTGINSFSFREVSYLDSIQIKLYKKFFFESKNEMRYSERGILYWQEFAEQPQRSNFELFLRELLFFRGENSNIAIGCRYFKRKDIRISELISQNNAILNDFISIAPEFLFEYNFSSGNKISFDIWYEFQTINILQKNELVNFYLSLNIGL